MGPKFMDCYLGLLFAMDDVAVYGYVTPTRIKIIIALELADAVVRDADVITVRPSSLFNAKNYAESRL